AIADGYGSTKAGELIDGWGGFGINCLTQGLPTPTLSSEDAARRRHRGSLMTGFCDAHVESIKFAKLLLDKSEAGWKRWNRDGKAHLDAEPHPCQSESASLSGKRCANEKN